MENHDVVKLISTEPGDDEKLPIKGLTEEVTPNIYKICIKPEDWTINCSIVECTLNVAGIHDSCICKAYPDDDMIINNADSREEANKLLKEIYNGEKLMINTDRGKIHCKFIGDRPNIDIYLELEEFPFFDVPHTKLGI